MAQDFQACANGPVLSNVICRFPSLFLYWVIFIWAMVFPMRCPLGVTLCTAVYGVPTKGGIIERQNVWAPAAIGCYDIKLGKQVMCVSFLVPDHAANIRIYTHTKKNPTLLFARFYGRRESCFLLTYMDWLICLIFQWCIHILVVMHPCLDERELRLFFRKALSYSVALGHIAPVQTICLNRRLCGLGFYSSFH